MRANIRERLLATFQAEMAEDIQIMNNGLLALEQGELSGETRQTTLDDVFRAAHSLKGAAGMGGETAVDHLAHTVDDVLDGLRKGTLQPVAALFDACYQAIDGIQIVQAAYQGGSITTPPQVEQALRHLESFRPGVLQKPQAAPEVQPSQPVETAEALQNKAAPQDAQQPELAIASPNSSEPPQPVYSETIRVSVNKLDALMAQVSELLVARLRAAQRLIQIIQLQEQVGLWQKEWLMARSAFNRILRRRSSNYVSPKDATYAGILERRPSAGRRTSKSNIQVEKDAAQLLKFTALSQEHLRHIDTLLSALRREQANDATHLALAIQELEEEIKQARMQPLSSILAPLKRTVRDLGQQTGKQIRLQVTGDHTELDKSILDQIQTPLIHLLRNAIDHGIQPPDRRIEKGKPAEGVITITAEQAGQEVIIQVSDDGNGLDTEALRAALIQQGRPDASVLSQADLAEAIFHLGISTSPTVTELSGRGIGLNIVRRNVEAVHGRVSVRWEPGKGTTFSLILPLGVTSSRSLLVQSSEKLFAVPFEAIERILFVEANEISLLEGQETLYMEQTPVSVVRLADLLELARQKNTTAAARLPVVVASAGEQRLGLIVDKLAGEQDIVIKGLGQQFARVGGISGAAIMGDGSLVLALNMKDLIRLAARSRSTPILPQHAQSRMETPHLTRRHILVVDDSITTRTLEKHILEAAGYAIDLANDGEEAWEWISVNGIPDLIVSDIAMPRLNGFDLTRRIKGDGHTAGVPVILVTSLDSAEDKARGIEAGADAYIVKSHFKQDVLLETIEQLL